jgi:hypothetical protein
LNYVFSKIPEAYLEIREFDQCAGIKELNPRRRVYVEIPKPSRVELRFPFEIIIWDTKVF